MNALPCRAPAFPALGGTHGSEGALHAADALPCKKSAGALTPESTPACASESVSGSVSGGASARAASRSNAAPDQASFQRSAAHRGRTPRSDAVAPAGPARVPPHSYAVVPAALRHDARLAPTDKLLWAEVQALSYRTGYCFATNAYLAALYGVSRSTVSRSLARLAQTGWVKPGKNAAGGRVLWPLGGATARLRRAPSPAQRCGGPLRTGDAQNTLNENNRIATESEHEALAEEILRYAKSVAGWLPDGAAAFVHECLRRMPAEEIFSAIGVAQERKARTWAYIEKCIASRLAERNGEYG